MNYLPPQSTASHRIIRLCPFWTYTTDPTVKSIPIYRHDGSLYQNLNLDIGLGDAIHVGGGFFYLIGRTAFPHTSKLYSYDSRQQKSRLLLSTQKEAFLGIAQWQGKLLLAEMEGLRFLQGSRDTAALAMPKNLHTSSTYLYLVEGHTPYPEDDEIVLFKDDLKKPAQILNDRGAAAFEGVSNFVDIGDEIVFSEYGANKLYHATLGSKNAGQAIETEYQMEFLTRYGRCVLGVDRSAQMIEVWTFQSHKADLLISYAQEGKALRNVMNIFAQDKHLYLLSLAFEKTANYLVKVEEEPGDQLEQVCF